MKNYTGRRPGGKRIVLALVLLCILFAAVLEGLVLSGNHDDGVENPGVMIILGAQVKSFGPSVLLQDRLDKALAYLEVDEDIRIVVSGGQGSDEPMSEAQCMYNYLIASGIDGDRILMEDQSHNTSQNLLNSKALLEQAGEDTTQETIIVSNGFHLFRVRMLAARYGMDADCLAAPSSHLPSRLKSYAREPLALIKSFLLD